jgi:tetratricopeptide (TPR) repeat protein
MLAEYIEDAMTKAQIEPEMADGTHRGSIPGFVGVCAAATTEADCRAELKAVLEGWVIFRASRGLKLPELGSEAPIIPTAEVNNQRLQTINQLEQQIEALKLELGGIKNPTTIWNYVYRFNEWYKNYFSLLTVAIGALAVIIGFWLYRVNPIQTYQDNLTKELATNYFSDLGDKFMNYGEFGAAAEVYQNALDVDKYDLRANSGLRAAQIFVPPKGEAFLDPNVVGVRLSHLRQSLGSKPEYAHLVLDSEGLNLRLGRNCSGARAKFEQAIKQKPSFVDAYNQLATTQLFIDSVDIAAVTANFEKARDNDPDQVQIYAPTLRDLGYCYLLLGRLDEAIQFLEDAYNRLQRAEISIKLGDAYRAKGNLEKAIYFHQLSLDGIESVAQKDEELYLGTATFVYLLEVPPEQKKAFIAIATKEQYKTLALYALSFDYALRGDTEQKTGQSKEATRDLAEASRRFDEAYKLDTNFLYSKYSEQGLRVSRGSASMSGATGWLNDRIKTLSSVKPVDDRVSKMCDK